MKIGWNLVVSGLFLLASAGTLAAEVPAVLSELPADAAVIGAIQPFTAINPKVNKITGSMGITDPNQPVDIAQLLAGQLQIPGQIDETRGIGFAVLDLEKFQETLAGFLPIKDAAAVSSALKEQGAQEAKGAQGILMIPEPNIFARITPKYLIFSPNLNILKGLKGGGYQLTPAQRDLFSNNDVAVVVNLKALLAQSKPKLLQQIQKNTKMQDHPGAKAISAMGIDRLSELQFAAVALNLSDAGINLNLLAQAQESTTLAGYLAGNPPADAAALAKFPANAARIVTFKFNPKLFHGPINAILDILATQSSIAPKLNKADVNATKDLIKQLYTTWAAGTKAAYLPPTSGPGMKEITILSNANGQAGLDTLQKLVVQIEKLSAQAGYANTAAYQSGAGEAAGIKYDEMTFDLTQLPIPEKLVIVPGLITIDKQKISLQLAQVENKLVITEGAASMEAGIKLAQQQPAPSAADDFGKTLANLPKSANFLIGCNVQKAIQGAMMAQPQGMQSNPMLMMLMGVFSQVQSNLGLAVTLENGQARASTIIPTDLLQTVMQVGMQMMMMGGMQGGPGGPGSGEMGGAEPAPMPRRSQPEPVPQGPPSF